MKYWIEQSKKNANAVQRLSFYKIYSIEIEGEKERERNSSEFCKVNAIEKKLKLTWEVDCLETDLNLHWCYCKIPRKKDIKFVLVFDWILV